MGCWLRTKIKRFVQMNVLLFVATYFALVLYSALSIARGLTVPLKGQVCCFDLSHEEMHFKTADGLTLAGWYVPPQNGAVVILLHPYYGNRLGVLPVARMLMRHGYGVLMYDQRASGESEGDVRSLGWLDIDDVRLALDWLRLRQAGAKVGVFGCSIGGAMAMAAAAQNPSIGAVAADGPSYLTFDESEHGNWWFDLPVAALYTSFVALRAQTFPHISTRYAAQEIAPRSLLLISSGERGERQRVDGFFNAAGEGKSRWHIPEVGHCSGAAAIPNEYEQHLTEFFDQAFFKR